MWVGEMIDVEGRSDLKSDKDFAEGARAFWNKGKLPDCSFLP